MAARSKQPHDEHVEPPELIDLRVTTPLRFAELVADPLTDPDELVDALVAEDFLTSVWPDDPLLLPWRRFLAPLADLGNRTTYIGSFRASVNRAAEAASGMGARDRAAAAGVVLRTTARHARTHQDFLVALRLASRIDPGVTGASLLRAVIHATHNDGVGPLDVLPGLSAALEILVSEEGPVLSNNDVWILRAAFARLSDQQRDEMEDTLRRLHPKDREVIDAALGHRRKRWPLRLRH